MPASCPSIARDVCLYRLSPDLADDGSERAASQGGSRRNLRDRRRRRVQTTRGSRRFDGCVQESFAQHGDDRRQLVPAELGGMGAGARMLLRRSRSPISGAAKVSLDRDGALGQARRRVDRSRDVLSRGRELARRRKIGNIVWKRASWTRAAAAETMDVVLLSQALHHAEKPARADRNGRILRPGGRVLMLDLREHGEAWVRAKLGDRWLGFSDAALQALMAGAGFEDITVRVGARRTGDPFVVLIASGRKAA
jgi:ArsR family transcriptional regulator